MSGQEWVLWAMVLVGIPGALVISEPGPHRNRKKVRIAGAVWIAFWWFPPLTAILLKGVFG